METAAFEKTIQGIMNWLKWKFAYMVYLLCAAIPITLYIISLLVMAISRRSTVVLPITMSVMLHPLVMVPIGVTTKAIEQYLMAKLFKTNSVTMKILHRLFTYSLNLHLALIATLLYYLYNIWIALEVMSSMNFDNEPFNRCECIVLGEYGQQCQNKETENSFQNLLIGVSIRPFLIAFLVASILCHIIHSLAICFPAPIKFLDFVLGNSNSTSDTSISNSNNQSGASNTVTKLFKLFCAVLSIAYICIASSSHYFAFGRSLTKETECQTIDNFKCTLPFEYMGHKFWTCADLPRGDVPKGYQWCATDADKDGNFKSIGECKDATCPSPSKLFPCILTFHVDESFPKISNT